MSHVTSLQFYESGIQNIDKYDVSEEVRSELRSILEQLLQAAKDQGKFESQNPSLELPAFGGHLCPYCGSRVTVGGNACSSCNRAILWATTPPLSHAGYTTKQGHTYSQTVSGPCKPELHKLHQGYCQFRAQTLVLERSFVVLKERSTSPSSESGQGASNAKALFWKAFWHTPEKRNCPKCEMSISSNASRCPHCTSEISPVTSIGGDFVMLGCFVITIPIFIIVFVFLFYLAIRILNA